MSTPCCFPLSLYVSLQFPQSAGAPASVIGRTSFFSGDLAVFRQATGLFHVFVNISNYTLEEMSSHIHPISRKRKQREPVGVLPLSATKAEPTAGVGGEALPPSIGNRLLAGYMAHEFLTNGTLFGRQWAPKPPESTGSLTHVSQTDSVEHDRSRSAKSYDEVAYLLKTDGAHIPGIVNPTQLGLWLQM